MPSALQIENADPLTIAEGLELLALIRASESYRQNLGLYPDLQATLRKEVQRQFAVTAATNAAPVVLTATAQNFINDEFVSVEGVLGNLGANGIWPVAAVAGDNLTLVGSAGSGVYTSGGQAISLKSKQLATIVAALDELGDGTLRLKGGKEGVELDTVDDREALLQEALSVLYALDAPGSTVFYGAGQRFGPSRIVFCRNQAIKLY